MSPATEQITSQIARIDDYWAWDSIARENRWTDGLPVAPPTVERVLELMKPMEHLPDPVGIIPPRNGVLSHEIFAIQCAMAGCEPRHIPVVYTAIGAMLDSSFNLNGVQCTTNPCAPLVIVSGPLVRDLGFHTKEGSFGGGSHSAAAVGRAIRLILWNVGGGQPGDPDMSPLGQPAKYLFSVAENGDDSPWSPFHSDFGFEPDDSCATVFACQSPEPLLLAGQASDILKLLRESLPSPTINMFHAAGQFLLTFNPQVAEELARGGYDKARLREWVFEHARYRVGRLREAGLFDSTETLRSYWGWRHDCGLDLNSASDSDELPIVKSPSDIHILVSGGRGQWWAGFSAGWGDYGGFAVCQRVEEQQA